MTVIVVDVGPSVSTGWVDSVELEAFHPPLLMPRKVVRVVVMLAGELTSESVYVT